MTLALSAESPTTLLEYLEAHRNKTGLYLLDIDLQSDINGIELATKIKKMDVSATIVFITTHSEMVHYVFRVKLEAMEYILKDSPPEEIEERVIECLHTTYQRFLEGKHAKCKYFTVKAGEQKFNIPHDDILFFESNLNRRNKILLHKVDGMVEFYGTITDVSSLGMPFCKCHQSFVVNVQHVKRLDKVSREIEMIDGTIIPVAKRKMTEFSKCMSAQIGSVDIL